MLNKIFKGIIGLLGLVVGYSLIAFINSIGFLPLPDKGWIRPIVYVGFSALVGLVFLSFSNRIMVRIKKMVGVLEEELQKFSVYDIILSSTGLIIGLIIAHLLSTPIYNMEIRYINMLIPLILYIIIGYLGLSFPLKKKDDIYNFFINLKKTSKEVDLNSEIEIKKEGFGCPKILDTSAIIDGRILDICKTKFIEGPLVVPEFVLEELQRIADSSDGLKRTRGRRGLDIINEIQKELDIEVIISEEKFEDIKEVDSKLLKLTKELNGKIVTNDYNLNKVAEVQGINVLNINDLANAVKPIVLPGEGMRVHVVKDGKEFNQGLAYLDDGTMIVVEDGRKYIGEHISVIVTSVLQTSAGRMIFARPN